jgi:nitrogen fixation protein FixH
MESNNGRQMKNTFFDRNRWLIAIIAFLTVVFMVNSALLYVAVATDDGLVDEDYYRKGLFYDKGLEGEKALGWEIGLSFTPGASLAAPAKIRVDITRLGSRSLTRL